MAWGLTLNKTNKAIRRQVPFPLSENSALLELFNPAAGIDSHSR